MNTYPISLTSSKKQPSSLTNSLLKRSACQDTNLNEVKSSDYCHILKGKYVYLEWYINGRLTQSLYSRYIQFMGAILYKRLFAKVNVAITNAQGHQLGALLDRVQKSCPACKVVNSLWLEKCFQMKQFVPFDGYELEREKKRDKEQQKDTKNVDLAVFDQRQIDSFTANICQDIQLDFKEFAKQQKNRLIEYAGKNTAFVEQQLFKARQFDLGPRPLKRRQKNSDDDPDVIKKAKKRKSEGKKPKQKAQQPQRQKQQVQEPTEQIQQANMSTSSYHLQPVDIAQMMQKYLSNDHILSQSQKKQQQLQPSERQLTDKTTINTYTKSNHSVSLHVDTKKYQNMIKMQITSKMKPNSQKYKNAQSQYLSRQRLKRQDQEFISSIRGMSALSMVLITSSSNLSEKIKNIQESRVSDQQVSLIHVKYEVFWSYIDRQVPSFQPYYLFNPKRIKDRPQFYALTCKAKSKIAMASHCLLQDIDRYNFMVRSGNSPLIAERRYRFKHEKQLSLPVKSDRLTNKKVVFIKPLLQIELLKVIVSKSGAIWITQSEFMLGKAVDLIIATRFILSDKSIKNMSEEQLWKQMFPVKEISSQ